jgi:hypothetical protein
VNILTLFKKILFIFIVTAMGVLNANDLKSSDIYQSQNLQLSKYFSGVSFKIQITTSIEQSTIGVNPEYLLNCFKTEIEDNSGNINDSEDETDDIYISIVISKYVTSKIAKGYFKTFIDINYLMFDEISNNKISEDIFSISGNGESSKISNLTAIHKMIRQILSNNILMSYLVQINKSNDNRLFQIMNRYSKNLKNEFDRFVGSKSEVCSMAFIGFRNDDNMIFSNIFMTSLKNIWNDSKYHFYTRENVDQILNEFKLSQTGLVDEKSILKKLELKSVEYFITGHISKIGDNTLIETQIIKVRTGEIISSKAINF